MVRKWIGFAAVIGGAAVAATAGLCQPTGDRIDQLIKAIATNDVAQVEALAEAAHKADKTNPDYYQAIRDQFDIFE